MMRGLMYGWKSAYEDAIKMAFEKIIKLDYFSADITDYDNEPSIYNAVESYFIRCSQANEVVSFVFSINYIPVLSKVCQKYNVKYISWSADSPMFSYYSKTVVNPCNYIFTFDKVQLQELKNLGAKNCYSMSLGTNTALWNKNHNQTNNQSDVNENNVDITKYICDISFMGNLYNDAKTDSYSEVKTFTPYLKGFFEGIMQSQLKIYGYNFIDEMLSDNILKEIQKCMEINTGEEYFECYRSVISNILNRHISRLERIEVLDAIDSEYEMFLYTNSSTDELKANKIINKGYADYYKDMPNIFRYSKINLNITSKSIVSGIPLRVFDVLGNRGFLISNYQPELAESFQDGVELVMYENVTDLKEKIAYYIKHEDEREAIALRGYEKVEREYTFEKKIRDILGIVFQSDVV